MDTPGVDTAVPKVTAVLVGQRQGAGRLNTSEGQILLALVGGGGETGQQTTITSEQ